MIPDSTNIVIIGGGPGGYIAAIRAAQLGAQVVLIEKDTLGGTCLKRGCIPTKALLQSANTLTLVKKAEVFGVFAEKATLDFSLAMKWKETVVGSLVGGVSSLMRKNKVNIIKGTGILIEPKRVKVLESKEEIKGDSIIIATGSKPLMIPIKGINESGVMTSDDVLVMNQLPQSVLIIGGGIVGLEFAQILGKMGVKVTVVEIMPHILPGEDVELTQMLEAILREDGIDIFCGGKVTDIESTAQGAKRVLFTTADGGNAMRMVEKVLLAMGRCPYTDDLGIEKVGIALDNGRIVVDERMETNIRGVYAVGDVVGRLMLANVAMSEGRCAAENAMGLDSKMDYRVVPRCIYTSPEMAAVGLTEAEANKKYQDVQVGRFPFIANGRALTLNETRGMAKIVTNSKYGEILGVHIIGPEASELIAEAALAIKLEATPQEIASCIHAHPTLSEAVMEAALGVEGRAIHF
ncbi:dihydrolipoyl dehydrogenase [Chloroflexota bacterium]